jgi:hypothetical protein
MQPAASLHLGVQLTRLCEALQASKHVTHCSNQISSAALVFCAAALVLLRRHARQPYSSIAGFML